MMRMKMKMMMGEETNQAEAGEVEGGIGTDEVNNSCEIK